MDKLASILELLIYFFSSLYITIVVIRFLLQLVRADFYNPLSQFVVKATNPLLLPMRKVIPGLFGIDMASLLLAIILQVLAFLLLGFVQGRGLIPLPYLVLESLRALIFLVLNIYFFSFIIMVVISWVAPHTYNPVIGLINSITEPVLKPIRRVIPPIGGLDLSIMFSMLAIAIIRIILS